MQIEVPQIDPTLWKRFSLEARHRGTDVSELLDEALRQFLGMPQLRFTPKEEEDRVFERLAGTWTQEEAEEFERNTAYFSRIDHDIWT